MTRLLPVFSLVALASTCSIVVKSKFINGIVHSSNVVRIWTRSRHRVFLYCVVRLRPGLGGFE